MEKIKLGDITIEKLRGTENVIDWSRDMYNVLNIQGLAQYLEVSPTGKEVESLFLPDIIDPQITSRSHPGIDCTTGNMAKVERHF